MKKQKAWCYFCDKVFDNEVYLISHQRAVHFRCPICKKQKRTLKHLVEHFSSVHKQIIEKVPGALPDRSSPDNDVFGMKGIPEGVYIKWLLSNNPDFKEKAKNINLDGAVFASDVTKMAFNSHKAAAQNITYNQLNQFNAAVNINPGQGTIITARGLVDSNAASAQPQQKRTIEDINSSQRKYEAAMKRAKEIIQDAMFQAERERKRKCKERAKNEIQYFEPEQNGLSVFEMRAKYLAEKNNQ